MKRRFVADLHIHSLLSPCAAVEMTPRNIVWHAAEYGVDIIAITDHNACDNVTAALDAAKATPVTVLPGMEVETREEVHVITLFAKMRQLKLLEAFVEQNRSGRLNDERRFGAQFIVDAADELMGVKQEMLLGSLRCGLEQLCTTVRDIGGLCIASHVDRPLYSVLSQLGFIPPDLALDAVEVSRLHEPEQALLKFPAIGDFPVVSSSDAHTMEDFISGPKTEFFLAEPTLDDIRQALLDKQLRRVVV